jgi:hypothetical protein
VPPCRPKMAPHLAPQKLVSGTNVRMAAHRISAPRVLRFPSRHGSGGADVMPMSPEACEDRWQALADL